MINLKTMLAIFLITTTTFASDIDFVTENVSYERWPNQVESSVSDHAEIVNKYLGETLECRLVYLKFNSIEDPKLFKDGQYNISLTAKCNKSFSDFRLEIAEVANGGIPYTLIITYIRNGRLEHATFKLY